MKKTIYLLCIICCFSSCKDPLNKTDINLRLIKNEYYNGKMIAIFRIKRIMSNKFIKINITDTLTINGIKMDSVVYAIVADSLSTKNNKWSCQIKEWEYDKTCPKFTHLKKLKPLNGFNQYTSNDGS